MMRRGNNYSGPRWPFASRVAVAEPAPKQPDARARCARGHLLLTRRGVPYCATLPGEGPCVMMSDREVVEIIGQDPRMGYEVMEAGYGGHITKIEGEQQ